MNYTLQGGGAGGCVGCVNPDCDAFEMCCAQCGVALSISDRPTDPRDPWACADCLRAATLAWLDRWEVGTSDAVSTL